MKAKKVQGESGSALRERGDTGGKRSSKGCERGGLRTGKGGGKSTM